ncbi:hypothetical protein LINPERPRIM_LOCUS26726 [Linum perenne]
MGSVLSQAASGAGAFLGNLVTAPLKSIFGGSCDEICRGPWDVGCFVEHLCISNLFKFVLILVLCYIIVVFVYLLFKVGIFQCLIKSLCKMCWTAFATYCYALHDVTCCLCNKLTSVPRRRRRQKMGRHSRDIERGGSMSSSTSEVVDHHGDLGGGSRKRKSSRMREDGKRRFHGGGRDRGHHGYKMRVARDVSLGSSSVRLRSYSRRRRVRVVKGRRRRKKMHGGGYGSFKRRRLK